MRRIAGRVPSLQLDVSMCMYTHATVMVYIPAMVYDVKARQETYLLDELTDSADNIGCFRAADVR